jgi:hypothetical protein
VRVELAQALQQEQEVLALVQVNPGAAAGVNELLNYLGV